MIPLSPLHVLNAAHAFVGLTDSRSGATSGNLSDGFLREAGITARRRRYLPWHTAFVNHVGFWTHFDWTSLTSSWPLPPTASCRKLANFAREHDAIRTVPAPGDIFLWWNPARKRFVRSGFISAISVLERFTSGSPVYACHTVEGDTDMSMGHSGGKIIRHLRRLCPEMGDRFIRWTAIDAKDRSVHSIDEAVEDLSRVRRAA